MTHAFLDELLSDSRPVVERLLEEPAIPLHALVAELDAFDASLPDPVQHPMVDDRTAVRLSTACRALLARVATHPDQLPLAQVAVRYLVLDEDGDSDTDSPFGFDDDVEVFNAVCGAIGWTDLLIVGLD